ncbi:MAG: hypothetical protein ACOH5I_03230 [Oligoflexus sp.]
MSLPIDITPDDFDRLIQMLPETWLAELANLSQQNGLKAEQIRPFTDGSNLVAAIDEKWVIKVFPPFHRHQWESDHRVLQHLQNRLHIPA